MHHLYYNGFYLIIPILLIRYLVLAIMKEDGLQRAAYEPPVKERTAEFIYHLTLNIIVIYMFFLTIHIKTTWNFLGIGFYLLGLILYLFSTLHFGKPINGFHSNGLYKLSRNPMYVSFFIFFIGCVLLTNSYILLILLIIYQIGNHYVIKAEEKWCIETFGDAYKNYIQQVRRYL